MADTGDDFGTGSERRTGPRVVLDFDPENVSLEYIEQEMTGKAIEEVGDGAATKEQINKVLRNILEEKKLEVTPERLRQVSLSVAELCQLGATSPKFKETRRSSSFKIVVTVAEIRRAVAAGFAKDEVTVRKLARGMKDLIAKVATTLLIEGNLSKAYKIDNPDYDPQELPWVSDFQTFNRSKEMPDTVKQWLLANYKARFKPKQVASKEATTKSS